MRKGIICLAIVCGFLAVSCGSSKQITSIASLGGEWNIVEVDGHVLTSSVGQSLPSIGFDEESHRIFGNSGCNRMMGTYQTDSDKPGSLSLGPIGSTRMACPDMNTEQKVLTALQKVKSFKTLSCGKGKGASCKVLLCGEKGETVAIIEKAPVNISALNGEWTISRINNEPIGQSENEPFIGFNMEEGRIYGSTGCNRMNGFFLQDKKDPLSVSFGQIATTMMACPDMDTERKVLDALNAVKSFTILKNNEVELFDANGKPVVTLIKK